MGSGVGVAGFCGPCVGGHISVFVESACVRDCRVLGLYKVGIVSWSAGDEYVGGTSSLVTGSGRMGGEDMGRGKEWMRRGRKSSWEGGQWILAQEMEGEGSG
jgi:hypothetical protein